MKRILIYISFLMLLLPLNGKSQSCIIHGSNKDYAGKTLEFFVYEDLISETTKDLFSIEIDDEGKFNTEFTIEKETPVFCLIGIYKLWFIAVPGNEYELALPDFVPKTNAEKYNPFFQPVYLMAGVLTDNKEDLNTLVNNFQYDLEGILNNNIIELMTEGKESDVDKYVDSLRQKYPQKDNEFFNTWKKFRLAKLKRIAYERNHRFVINKYFRQDKVHYQNPAYMELFLDLFSDYFGHFLIRPDGKELKEAVDVYKSPHQISKVLSRNFELDNMALREYAVIKALKDAYHREDFKKNSILICLDSISLKSDYPEHRIAAENVINELMHLAPKTAIPDIKLEDKNGELIDLADMNNQFTYLAFVHTELIPCRKQFGKLSEMADDYKNDFKIWLIVMDEDQDKAQNYLEKFDNKNWKITFPADKENINSVWELKTYPMYYLVGPERKFVFSPAAAPTEKFENYFFQYTRNRK